MEEGFVGSNDHDKEQEIEASIDEEEEGGDGKQDDGHQFYGPVDAEIEDLEKEIVSLRNQEQDILKNLRNYRDEDLLKSHAVKNQKALCDRALEIRFLLQKPFSSSNKLPQEPARSLFSAADEHVKVAYADLISSCESTLESLFELQEVLVQKNPSTCEFISAYQHNLARSAKDPSEDTAHLILGADKDWFRVSEMHSRIAPFRNRSVDTWYRKAQVSTGAAAIKGKLKAFGQNISDQVASYMRGPSKMVAQMQLRRSAAGVFGDALESASCSLEEEANCDPELLDDSEFYQQLLKEFLETFDSSATSSSFYALKNVRAKKRKLVDRRASKSRKIRYNVHEKIVNFMVPLPTDVPPMAHILFQNLFGLGVEIRNAASA